MRSSCVDACSTGGLVDLELRPGDVDGCRGVQRDQPVGQRVGIVAEQEAQQEEHADQHHPGAAGDGPQRNPGRQILHAQRHAAPARRNLVVGARLDVAQRLVDVAADTLQFAVAAMGAAILALEAKQQAGVHELEQVVARRRIGERLVQLLEEADTRGAHLEELRQHRVLHPDAAVGAGQVLDDVVGGAAQDVFGDQRFLRVDAGRHDLLLEFGDRLRHIVHQRNRLHVDDVQAQPAKQDQQRRGGLGDRVGGREFRGVRGIERDLQRNAPLGLRGRLGRSAGRRRPHLGARRQPVFGLRGAERTGIARGRCRPLRRQWGQRFDRIAPGRTTRIGDDNGPAAERIVLPAHLRSSMIAQRSN